MNDCHCCLFVEATLLTRTLLTITATTPNNIITENAYKNNQQPTITRIVFRLTTTQETANNTQHYEYSQATATTIITTITTTLTLATMTVTTNYNTQ